VRTEGDTLDLGAVAGEGTDGLAGLHVPGPHLHVRRTGAQRLAIRSESHAGDVVGMSLQDEQFLARLRLKQLDVLAGSEGDRFAVGTDADGDGPAKGVGSGNCCANLLRWLVKGSH